MRVLADEKQIAGMLDRLVAQATELMSGHPGPWAIVGIRSRGDIIAQRLAERLDHAGLGTVDIALYRDDLSEAGPQPIVRTTELNFPLDDVSVLLVDDVLMTGRSVRAAMQSIMDFGRPKRIRLLVLVDRGGRELPIAPDLVGLTAEPGSDEIVEVRLRPQDPDDLILMCHRPESAGADRPTPERTT